MTATGSLLLASLMAASCDGASDVGGERYSEAQVGAETDLICPGDPSGICDFSGDPDLRVGAAKVSITPTDYELWEDVDGDSLFNPGIDVFFDCGVDRRCPGDPGYEGADEGEGNNVFDAVWMAGFDNARPMSGVAPGDEHEADGLWARATWLSQGETDLAVVAVDLIGYFYDEVLDVRELAKQELGVDHVVIVSTHLHEGPDTLGIWGRSLARSGVNPAYMSDLRLAILDAIAEAKANAVASEMLLGSFTITEDLWEGTGVNNVNIDTRDPKIVDPTLWTARFVAEGSGETIATWVNWPDHAETESDKNNLISSDFAHSLRTTVEYGAATGPEGPLDGLGGVAIYLQGAVGGMMTPLRCDTIDLDGQVYSEDSIEKAHAVGRVIGYHALQAQESATRADQPLLSYRAKRIFVQVQNTAYHFMFQLGIIDRALYNYSEARVISGNNMPDALTEVDLLQIGPLSIITIPGELFPEWAIGGYDGSLTGPLSELVRADSLNPPPLQDAPRGPYLKELMPGSHKMIFGLANDELGYLVPPYNFQLDEGSPYLSEAPGDHYEETNSIGPDFGPTVIETATALINFVPGAAE